MKLKKYQYKKVKSTNDVAIKKIKSGQGPFFLECKTYRFVGHSRSDTNKYRQKSEEIFWKKKKSSNYWKC